jgi:hypothetical protein
MQTQREGEMEGRRSGREVEGRGGGGDGNAVGEGRREMCGWRERVSAAAGDREGGC